MTDTARTWGERARLLETGWERDLAYENTAERIGPCEGADVLVEVEACGVCYRDLIDRAGRFPFLRLPVVPGHEAVGRVVEIGPSVREWNVGDRVATMHRDHCGACARCVAGETSLCEGAAWVFGILADGGYARHLRAPEKAFYAVPDATPAAHAAILHCTYGTAFRDLVTLGGLRPKERVLVTGANGGVGAAAVEIAARLGADVTAVVRSDAHVEFVKSRGASAVVVDPGGTFHEKVGRVDLVLEAVGFDTFGSSLRSLGLGGRMVVVGNIAPEKVNLNLGYLITHGLTLRGGSGATRREMAEVVAMHEREPFRVAVDRILPLARADEAQRAVKAGGLRGRVVLVPVSAR